MIVPSMTMEEVRVEWGKEFPIIFRKACFVAKAHKKTMKFKDNDQEVKKFFDYYSKFKNNWIYNITFTKKRDYYIFLLYNYDQQGLNAFTIMGGLDGPLFVFTAHFFKRYNERRKLNLVKPNDILRAFIEDNNSFTVQSLEDASINLTKIFCTCDSGILLGTEDKKSRIIRINTFLTTDLLKKDQKELADQLNEEFKKDGRDYVKINF